MTNSKFINIVRNMCVIPAAGAVFLLYVTLMWLFLLMLYSFVGWLESHNSFIGSVAAVIFFIFMFVIVLVGYVIAARSAVRAGAFVAPTMKTETAILIVVLYSVITIVCTIAFWNDIGGGLWRWWLVFCEFASIVGAVGTARSIFRTQRAV